MNPIDRRSLFSLGAAGAGLSLVPGWLRRWFGPQDGQDGQDPQDGERAIAAARRQQLGAARARSQAEGKPLVVFVVPKDDDLHWDRGAWYGAFLNHAGELAALELAMTIPACATAEEVAAALRVEVVGEPAMLLVDGGERPKVTPVAVELGQVHAAHDPDVEWEEQAKRDRARVEKKLGEWTEALLKAMHAHGANVANCAAAAQARLSDGQRAALSAWFAGKPRPSDQLIVRGAALVRRAAAGKDDGARKQLLGELVAAYERAVVKQPIAGGRWAHTGGCGIDLERETEEEKRDRLSIACGMGSQPPLTQRFLSFYHMPWRE